MHTEQISLEVTQRELALRQKLEIQFEVMKLLHFLPPIFDATNPDAGLVDETIWGMWSDTARGQSNAAIFSDEFDSFLSDPTKLVRLKTDRDNVVAEFAAKLRDKNTFLN